MTAHPGPELAAYAAGDVAADERTRIERHLADCAECRETVAEFRALLDELAATTPAPPDVAWARYRAEVRARLAAHRGSSWRARWLRPVPAAAAAAVAAALVIIVYAALPSGRPADLAGIEYDGLAGRLPLIDHYRVVDQLELLEDLDVIRNLDGLSSTRGS
jgi:anti-sigma factor RsiW